METDGAQDEAPRYPKPLLCGIALFKELKLDALIHGVNAAGLSAFNPGNYPFWNTNKLLLPLFFFCSWT